MEARIVYTCQPSYQTCLGEYILKIKVQIPGNSNNASPAEGPSNITALECTALSKLRDASATHAPRLVGFKQSVQGEDGPLPGGYISYTVMNKLPGDTLFNIGFWGRSEGERAEITQKFLEILRCGLNF